jgi:hypothetical protein
MGAGIGAIKAAINTLDISFSGILVPIDIDIAISAASSHIEAIEDLVIAADYSAAAESLKSFFMALISLSRDISNRIEPECPSSRRTGRLRLGFRPFRI